MGEKGDEEASKTYAAGRMEKPFTETGKTQVEQVWREIGSSFLIPGHLLQHSKPALSSHAFQFGDWKTRASDGQNQGRQSLAATVERPAADLTCYSFICSFNKCLLSIYSSPCYPRGIQSKMSSGCLK